ncbi:MAG TPA: flagellar basal body P-ring formation chaperone FlgA [bacterium]|nr:flagellar basal body P-ring formation chaperone FlgA [bacterium]
MTGKAYQIIFSFLIFFHLLFGGEKILPDFLQKKILDLYSVDLKVNRKDIKFQIYHVPPITKESVEDLKVTITPQNQNLNPGYQRLKIKTWRNQQLQNSYSISMKVTVKIPVLLASEKIRYGQPITSDQVSLEKIEVDRNLDKFFLSQPNQKDLISTQLIRKNEIIKKSMVKSRPDVKRGEQVKVHLISGAILIKTEGRIRKDCSIGESVQVTLESSRRSLRGQVKNPDLVVVNLQ